VQGTWKFNYEWQGNYYEHDAFLTQSGNTITGINGGYPVGGSYQYAWVVTGGSVSGNTIHLTMYYTVGAVCSMTMDGNIAPDGTMSGTWSDNCYGDRTNTWVSTSGTALSDSDCDGVYDSNDLCSGTVADVPTVALGTNRWKWYEEDWIKGQIPGKGKGPQIDFTIEQTHGCSCFQILDWLHENYPEEYGNMLGHYKYGCSISIMQDFIALTQPE
jgi:hypothetical protein